jgi:hypothetical protein
MAVAEFVLENRYDFETLRCGFFTCFEDLIVRNLKPWLGNSIELQARSLNDEVQSKFLVKVMSKSTAVLCPALHGTSESNFTSIFNNGFLIPGDDNDLQRQNGWAFGKGVYVSNINAAWLSLKFSHSAPSLIVCAVLQDESVSHIRDCQVVPDTPLLVPVCIARGAIIDHAQNLLPSPDALRVLEVFHNGHTTITEIRRRKQNGTPANLLLQEGYSEATLESAGYEKEELHEKRIHPFFGAITFSELQRRVQELHWSRMWARMQLAPTQTGTHQ